MFFTQLDNFFLINQPIFATKERSKPGQLWTPAPHANILSHELAGNRKAEQEIAAEVMIWAEFFCSFAESGKEREQKRESIHLVCPQLKGKPRAPSPPRLADSSHLPGKPKEILIAFSQGRRKGSPRTGSNPTVPIAFYSLGKSNINRFSPQWFGRCALWGRRSRAAGEVSLHHENPCERSRGKNPSLQDSGVQWELSAKVTAKKESSQKGGFKSQWALAERHTEMFCRGFK